MINILKSEGNKNEGQCAVILTFKIVINWFNLSEKKCSLKQFDGKGY